MLRISSTDPVPTVRPLPRQILVSLPLARRSKSLAESLLDDIAESRAVEPTPPVPANPLVEAVQKALRDGGYFPLRNLSVTAQENGAIVLEGSVASFYLKQVAQTRASTAKGVSSVVNNIAVSPSPNW